MILLLSTIRRRMHRALDTPYLSPYLIFSPIFKCLRTYDKRSNEIESDAL